MSAGGKRKGAGRKKGSKGTHTLEAAKLREMYLNKVSERFAPIVQAQIDLAEGVLLAEPGTIVTDPISGKVYSARVYREKPDSKSLTYILDQSVGKPKETIEHQGEIKSVVQLVMDLENGDPKS